jgi:hypothetical protein
MARLVLNQLKHGDLELDSEYLVMFRHEDGQSYFEYAVFYYESQNSLHLWCFPDEADPVEVGEEVAVFQAPENGIIEDGDFETLDKDDIIEDGFGSAWSAWCPECQKKAMHVVRPGKVQCGNCG